MMKNIASQTPMILALDVGGMPLRWLHWQEATTLHVRGQFAWVAGNEEIHVMGGINRISGQQSVVTLNSIVSISGERAARHYRSTPLLTNRELFRRDRNICLYCGEYFMARDLTRDHVIPRAKGGRDVWDNVVTACRACNHRKGCRTPIQADMELVAVPYTPNYAEFLILANRRILTDQMAFLQVYTQNKKRH